MYQISGPYFVAEIVPNFQSRSKSSLLNSRKKVLLKEGVISTSPTSQDGEPRIGSYSRLLMQYIRSFLPYLKPFLHFQPEEPPCRDNRYPLIICENTTALIIYTNYCNNINICKRQLGCHTVAAVFYIYTNVELVTNKYKLKGLFEKHVEATWNLGTISAIWFRYRETM